jgi:hypothetical protein
MCKIKYQLMILGLAFLIYAKIDILLENDSHLTIIISLIGLGYIIIGIISNFFDK